MANLPWRVAGVLLLALCVVVYEPATGSPLHRLLLPLAMAAAAGLMVQNLAAVAFGTFLLAIIHSHPGSGDPIEAIGYPVVAAAAGLLLLWVLLQRFRARIHATHDARWRQRHIAAGQSAAGQSAAGRGAAGQGTADPGAVRCTAGDSRP